MSGRTEAQTGIPIFESNTELVTVPVVVKDRHGNRVHGLTKNDFRIFESGHEVQIRSFETAPSQARTPHGAGIPGTATSGLPESAASVPVILFFDQLNTPADEQAEVRKMLARWYAAQHNLAAPTCVMLYTGSVLRIVQQPTLDAATVQAAIANIPTTITSHGAGASGELPLPEGANENLPNGYGDGPLRTMARTTYFWRRNMSSGDAGAALIYAGQLFSAWPGQKTLIWISAGTTERIPTEPLQAAQVKLYALNIHTNIAYGFIASFTTPQTTSVYETEVNDQLRQNLRTAAQETGGELCNNSLEPQGCVQRAMDDSADEYLLTYETHSRTKRHEWRPIQVKLNRPGLTVYSRTGVMIAPDLKAEEKKREQIAAALASPVNLPGLLLDVKVLAPGKAGQGVVLSLLMHSDAQHPGVWNAHGMDFTVAGIVLGKARLVQRFGEDIHGPLSVKNVSELDASGLTWTYKIGFSKDAIAVRVVVRDNADGRIGSITRSLP